MSQTESIIAQNRTSDSSASFVLTEAPPQFGVSGEKADRDWPLITVSELAAVLAAYGERVDADPISWHSPRPFSAAVLARTREGEVRFVKRHHIRLRDVEGLHEEHRFIAHLRSRGVAVADVLRTIDGPSALTRGEWTYEVHRVAPGVDAYCGAMSWTPFRWTAHAFAAGQALARLHRGAADYAASARRVRPLISSYRVIGRVDLMTALDEWVIAQPWLHDALNAREWQSDIATFIAPHHARLQPFLAQLPSLWTHGDWHASNLLWTGTESDATVQTVLDFGLSDRTCAVYDLALAIERNVVEWLAPEPERRIHLDHVDALIAGYTSVLSLGRQDLRALAALLPIVHTEFALSEVGYFDTFLQSSETASIAYDGYLLDHARWLTSGRGAELIEHLSERASGKLPS